MCKSAHRISLIRPRLLSEFFGEFAVYPVEHVLWGEIPNSSGNKKKWPPSGVFETKQETCSSWIL